MEIPQELPKLSKGKAIRFDDGSVVMGDKDGNAVWVTKTWATSHLWRQGAARVQTEPDV